MINFKSTKLKWTFSLAGVALVLVLVTAFTQSDQEDFPVEEPQEQSISYPTTEVQLLSPSHQLSVPAELMPGERVAIYAKISGFVKSRYVDRGDQVKKGQLLAELEAPEMQQQVLSDKATQEERRSDYEYATQAYNRMEAAAATHGAVADIELDRARSAMHRAKAAYEAASAKAAHSSQLQQYLRITAPFDGVVTQRNFSLGALAGTNSEQPLFEIAQNKQLRLILSLPEKHAASVQNGMKATFSVRSRPGRAFEAKLARTSGLVDNKDRSLKLEFDVENTDGSFQGGEYAQVQLNLRRRDSSFWVPAPSVLRTQSGDFIMTLNNGSINKIPVRAGIRMDTLTEVFGDLNINDQVLLKPSEEIQLGQKRMSSNKKNTNI